MIIYEGRVENIVSTKITEHLNFKVERKKVSYQLAWVDDCDRFTVQNQYHLSFSIGMYKDEIICYVISITTAQLHIYTHRIHVINTMTTRETDY